LTNLVTRILYLSKARKKINQHKLNQTLKRNENEKNYKIEMWNPPYYRLLPLERGDFQISENINLMVIIE
jgi:hypothetical protein